VSFAGLAIGLPFRKEPGKVAATTSLPDFTRQILAPVITTIRGLWQPACWGCGDGAAKVRLRDPVMMGRPAIDNKSILNALAHADAQRKEIE
jgi:hypothetical protein